jgi:CRP-like cAMP-binding protein
MKYNYRKTCRNIYQNIPAQLLGSSAKISLKKGEHLHSKNDKARGFYFIEKGLIALTDVSPNGSESLFRVFSDDFFVGYRTFAEGDSYHASALALTDSTVYRLPFANIEQIQEQYPEVLIHLIKMLSVDLRISEERFNDITGKRVMSRIIDSLIFLKQRRPDYQWTGREIGEFCGAKTETVTRTFTKLEELGLINKDGRNVQIPSLDLLLKHKEEVDLGN